MIRGNERAIDLGLEVLLALKAGERLSSVEIAAYCDAAREILGLKTQPFQHQDLFFLESRALVKLRKEAERRRKADNFTVDKAEGLTSEEIVRLTDRKARYGRSGLPEHIARAMIAEYHRTNSLAKTARKFGRSRQAMWDILRRRTNLNPCYKRVLDAVVWKGLKFTPGKNGYLRLTTHRTKKHTGAETLLHRLIWIEHYGAIEEDHEIRFRDGDVRNTAIENLYSVHRREASRGRKSGNAWTKYYASVGPKPPSPSGHHSAKISASLRNTWGRYTPEQRAARIAKTLGKRWLQKFEEAA